MSAEVEAPRSLAAFPRPTSLYVPDVPRTTPILDTTSYSPFPTFPGGKNRDPYGLNAYLLHPDDSLWHYVDPMPDNKTANGVIEPQRSSSMEGEQRSTLPRARTVRKQRSLSLIKRPSPLSQPPVSSGEEDELEEKPVTLQRKRSNSLPLSPALSVEEQEAVVAIFREEITTPKTPKSGKKSLKRAFTKARKSVFGMNEINASIPPVPAVPELPTSTALAKPTLSSDNLDPSTPMTSRSNSNYSTISSASSSSSSEGVKTPGEGVSIDVAITGSKLANALQEAGDKKNKGKNWRGWLGGKKNGKLSVKDFDNSGSTTPLSDLSADSTPNSSTTDLHSNIPKVTLTPSPAIITPPQGSTPVLPPSEQLARQHSWASEQLRRASMRKLTQLRSPSPHPLALSLRRQNSKLPDEVAFSVRSDQRVFPMSVNSHKGLEGDLTPAQGGLWLNIAITKVMIKLDQGEQPDGILKTRKNTKRSIVPRPKGALDFINRAPYEERNMVFYPDNVFSPISMARPGYGVWDLDFSPYILGLSEMYEPSTLSWPTLPRTSTETSLLPTEFADALKGLEDKSEEDTMEMLKSPELAQDAIAAFKSLTANAPSSASTSSTPSISPAGSPKKAERPLSSFKPKGQHSQGDEIESSSESEEEESDDDEPLAVVAKRRSQSFQSQPRPSPVTQPPRPTSSHIRSLSQPATDKRSSKRLSTSLEAEMKWKEIQAQDALNTVARARELRAQNAAGQMEKQADADRIKEKSLAKRRSSMMDLRDQPNPISSSSSSQQAKHKRNSSASIGMNHNAGAYHLSPAIPVPSTQKITFDPRYEMNRRRVQSHNHDQQQQQQHLSPSRPGTNRAKSAGPSQTSGANERKRFSSFYEQKSNSTSSFHSAPSPHHQYAQPHPHQHFVHQHHPQMVLPHHHLMSNPQMQFPHQRSSMYGMNMYPTPVPNQMYGQGLKVPMLNGSGSNRTRMA